MSSACVLHCTAVYCTDTAQCMSDNIISSCHQRPIADQRWHWVTNKAFMLGPRPLLAASGPRNLLFVNRFIVRHDLEMMRYFILRILIFLWMYIYFSSPRPKWAFFSTFRFYYLNPRNLLFAFIISSLVGFNISERLFMSEENSKFRMKLPPITRPLWSGFSWMLQKFSNVVNARFQKKLFRSKERGLSSLKIVSVYF